MTTFSFELLVLGCCFVYSLVLAIRSRQALKESEKDLLPDYCNGLREEEARRAASDESRRKRINDAITINGSRLGELCELEPTTKSCLGLLPRIDSSREAEPTMEQIRSDINAFIEGHYRCVVLDEASYESRLNELLASGIRVEVVPEVYYELASVMHGFWNKYAKYTMVHFHTPAKHVAFRMLKLNPSVKTIEAFMGLGANSIAQALTVEYPNMQGVEKSAVISGIQEWQSHWKEEVEKKRLAQEKERVQDILNAPPEKAILEASIPQASSGTKGKARL